MISTSALCFMLVLSSTCAFLVPPDLFIIYKVEEISSHVAHDMAQVAKAADGLSTLELNDRLLDTLRSSLKAIEPKLRQISVQDKTLDIPRILAYYIIHNKELIDALASRRKVAPRFIGALALGITQVATDVVKMALTRY